MLLRRKLDLFTPSPYFAFTVHVDGLRERHDAAVDREGVFDEAVAAIGEAKRARLPGDHQLDVLHHRQPQTTCASVLDFLNDELEVDSMMISPGLRLREGARPGALPRRRADPASCSRRRSPTAGARRWRLNHSPLFLDFLEGKVDFQCTAWGIPSYSVFGWQRPCYLMSDGYATTYRELVETTDWERYGRGKDPRCANCMAHCGYEPTAVVATMSSLRQSLRGTLPPAR